MYSLRPMILDDIEAAIELARQNQSQSRYASLTFCKTTAREFVTFLLGCGQGQAYVLVDDRLGVVGVIAGMLSKLPWSVEQVANEVFFTIHPDHRGYKQAMMLLRAYVGWAKMSGAKLISVNADNDDTSDVRTVVLYERAGFKLAGRTLSMNGD